MKYWIFVVAEKEKERREKEKVSIRGTRYIEERKGQENGRYEKGERKKKHGGKKEEREEKRGEKRKETFCSNFISIGSSMAKMKPTCHIQKI